MQAKVLNITNLSDFNNYGQRLQTYALQTFIDQSFGVKMHTIDTRSFYCTFGKSQCFRGFESRYVNFLKVKSFTDDQIYNADVILVGGDQNWNGSNPYYTGKHYDSKIKLVSYSSSSVTLKTANDCRALHDLVQQLKKFSMVSFREKDSYEAARKAIGKRDEDISYHIDPVFLLDAQQWRSIERKPSFIVDGQTFDFAYLIGSHKNDVRLNDGIKEYIYYGNNSNADNISPDEFLWMVDHCRKFRTSSFHGVCFAVIMDKSVQVVNGKTNDFRMKNLTKTLQLQVQHDIVSCQQNVHAVIEKERARSYDWLSRCLSCCGFQYACYAKCNDIRSRSASGGMSAVIAQLFIDNGGAVYGAAYSDDFRSVTTVRVDSMNDYFKKISKSKYSFCQMPDIDQIRKDLESGIQVLFTGCPCQIKQLKETLGKEYSNLATVDLLCNGYSRPELLKKLVEEQERSESSKIVQLDMRPKHSFDVYVKFANGKEKTIQNVVTKVFVCNKENYIDECRSCSMHTAGNSYADLTIGDFWGYSKYKDICNEQFNPRLGSSIVYVNTSKGMTFFNSLKPQLEWRYLR